MTQPRWGWGDGIGGGYPGWRRGDRRDPGLVCGTPLGYLPSDIRTDGLITWVRGCLTGGRAPGRNETMPISMERIAWDRITWAIYVWTEFRF
jgi:hypothetical protein